MYIYESSNKLNIETSKQTNDDIILILQFFYPNNINRLKELQYCLKQNVNNKYITKIYLLNERIYNNKELGIISDKIEQFNVKKRLLYRHIYDFVELKQIKGYIVYGNTDIFLDDTINILNYTHLHKEKEFICLLRYNVENIDKNNKIISTINNSIMDSQDIWIYHSNFNIDMKYRKGLEFYFGVPGCDNKITYIMRILGFKIINCPLDIKTYHYHKSEVRNYTEKNRIPTPYLLIKPHLLNNINYIQVQKQFNKFKKHTFNDNEKLYNYLNNKIKNNETFIIPMQSFIENNVSLSTYTLNLKMKELKMNNRIFLIYNKKYGNTMKKECNILLKNETDLLLYTKLYIDAFSNCDMYLNISPSTKQFSRYSRYSKYINILGNIVKKDTITSYTTNISNFILNNPWTTALKNKKILLISPYVELFKEKETYYNKIYDCNLFPNCNFIYLNINININISSINKENDNINKENGNITKEEELTFLENLNILNWKLMEIKDCFDIALVDCKGYNNIICNEIFKLGKSAICIGDVLPMYFGIYNDNLLNKYKDIFLIYHNKYWTKL